jgi:hypothetical protein
MTLRGTEQLSEYKSILIKIAGKTSLCHKIGTAGLGRSRRVARTTQAQDGFAAGMSMICKLRTLIIM